MKIPIEVSEAMFKHAGVHRGDLHSALRQMNGHYLRMPFAKEWDRDNPTRFYDYVVTEWLLHYRAPAGSFAFRVAVPNQSAKHYFARWPDGTIIDLTAEQFGKWELVDYASAKKASMPNTLSYRAKVLNQLMFAAFLNNA